MANYKFGSIEPVDPISEFIAMKGPMSFQGLIADKLLMPKKEQIPFITNQSTCTFIDDNMKIYIYNSSNDRWYNPKDSSDYV